MEATGVFGGLGEALQKGGPWVVAIGITFAVSLGITLERFLRLFFVYPINGARFMMDIKNHVLRDDFEGAIQLCNGAKDAALAQVLRAGLERANRSDEQIQNAIDAKSLEMIPKLERRLPYLGLIANIATLLGLLGTISGLISSFKAVALADAVKRQQVLSDGISEAMFATALGLVTAIFTMIAHSILSGRATLILEQIDEFGVKLLDLLSTHRPGRTKDGGSKS
jgi:biopolymer transport protein ExbB